MAKKKKVQEVEAGSLRVGDRVVGEDDVTRSIVQLEKIIDPRGKMFLDTTDTEWYVKYDDGHRTLLSGTVSVAA